jgi:hypothetical protein
MTDWLPYDTAPKDGSFVELKVSLLYGGIRIFKKCHWVPEQKLIAICCEYCNEEYEYTQSEGWFENTIRLPVFCSPAYWRPTQNI